MMNSQSTTPLGIGLVGVGRHGSRYVQHLLHDLPGTALTAICRKSGGGSYAGTDIPVFEDYRTMIADPRVQAIVVVTPPSLCQAICLAAVEARKAILIEKPLALNGREARAMVEAAEQRGVLLMTAQTMRFDPTIMLLREQLRTIGRLQSAMLVSHIDTKANLMTGNNTPVTVGAILELGVHLLDLVRFLTGEDILDVRCTTATPSASVPETHAHAELRTSGGIVCTLDIARVESHRKGTAGWIGTTGTIKADWVARTLTRTPKDGLPESWALEPRPTILAILQAFVRAIRTGTPPPVTGLDGCLAVEAADACYRSAARDGAVVTCQAESRR
jgi:predicted dehydrogenase